MQGENRAEYGASVIKKLAKELTAEYQNDKLEFIKNPVVAEFLGLSSNTDLAESDLETSILSNLQKFLTELGKGYAFVARQQHIIQKRRIIIICQVWDMKKKQVNNGTYSEISQRQ